MARTPLYFVLLGVVGCFAQANPSQRLSESAYNMNNATRFGRMDVALELVGAEARESFTKTHASWGKGLRIVDLEFSGLQLAKKGAEADVFVTVSWQRFDDPDVRVTNLTQRWIDVRGTWSLISEAEKAGDGGLLDARLKAEQKPAPTQSRYQTRVIGAIEE